jgi:hypothetical protein
MKFAATSVVAAVLASESCCAMATSAADPVSDRKVGALVGAMLADAAVMPLHWIYDTAKIAKLVGTGHPEFFDPPSCPYYNYTLGENTLYGQQFMVYMKTLAAATPTSRPDPVALSRAFYDFYGAPGAPCAVRSMMWGSGACLTWREACAEIGVLPSVNSHTANESKYLPFASSCSRRRSTLLRSSRAPRGSPT